MTTTDTSVSTPTAGNYADINGLHLYYETHGSGRPLILLHGGLGTGDLFGPVRTELAANHQVITPDLQGHGRTADIDRPLDVRLMADDIAALIRHLGLDQPDLVGYSLGGGVALMTALKYPELISKVVVASAHIKYDALDPAMYAQQEQVGAAAADALKGTPMYEGYVAVAPRPEDFSRLLDKIGASMKEPFDFSEEVRGVKVPTMIVAADADMAPPSHYVEFFKPSTAACATGAGWGGAGRRADMPWRSCPA